MNNKLDKGLDGKNPNLLADKKKALKQLMPEAFVDGQLDPTLLAQILNTKPTTTSEDGERYGLNWPGKKLAFEEVSKQTYCTLTLDEAASSENWQDSKNIFIEGENLETLRVLQKAYFNKVKMIYIDPPYNTGKDFVYHDNYRQTEEEYCDDCDETENGHLKKAHKLNARDSGRFHSDWLTMMYPRLFLARNLLCDDGVIFVSIDDNEVHNLRMLMNEIFGEENFVAEFVWQRKSAPKGVPPVNMVVKTHEYIICYAKSENFAFIGEKRSLDSFSNPDNDPRGPWRNTNIKSTVKSSADSFTITDPTTGNEFRDSWAFSKQQLELMILEKQIIFPKLATGQVRAKEYYNEFDNENIPLTTVLGYFDGQKSSEDLTHLLERKVFDNPKSETLLQYLTKATLNDGIVLDFFSGSGTTAHAVMAQNALDGGNRQYICVQLPEDTPEGSEARSAGYNRISDIALERIKRAAKKVQAENLEYSGDLGVRVYRATESHFPVWRAKSYETNAELRTAMFDYVNTLPNGTPRQRADEVLLKLGYPLATIIVDKNGWYQADEVALVLDEEFPINRLHTDIIPANPKVAIVLESVFKTDEGKINFDLRCTELGIIFQTI